MSSLEARRLIGPTATSLGQVGSVVDVITLGLTIIGACLILGGLAYREIQTGASTVRTRLLSFLVLADLVMGVFGIISPTYYLATGHGPPSKVCSLAAFMLLSSFWAQYINAISLAASTFLILLHPLSPSTRVLQRLYMWILPFTWALSFIAAGIAWRVSGFAFRSGFCYIDSNHGPSSFSDIYAFAPRSVVLVVVVALYTRLFIFLRRPDRISTSQNSQSDEIRGRGCATSSTEPNAKWWTRKRMLGTGIAGESFSSPSSKVISPKKDKLQQIRAMDEKAAPWESLDLRIPDFASTFDPSTNPRHVTLAPPQSPHTESPLGGSRRNSAAFLSPPVPLIRTTTPSTPSSPEPSTYFTPLPSLGAAVPPTAPASLDVSTTSTLPSTACRPEIRSSNSSQKPLIPYSPCKFKPSSEESTLSEANSSSESEVDSLSPRTTRKHGERKQSRGMSLKDILDAEGPAPTSSAAMEQGPTASWGGQQSRETGSGSWEGQESLSAYMNRKASMLMILFPLAYVALFSVSLVRVIMDFALANKPIPALSAASRWMIFSQGIVDFAIYGVVEYKVKRDVRRKTSQGHFAPNPMRSGSFNNAAAAAGAQQQHQTMTNGLASQIA